ncbi:hypothetical protein KJ644_02715 [Candidatus Dependentiae bacterium]|nr:hypothetical protein [Candidatus Dependentiae bacterium]MBU4387361.1 hypothetical protein [Candidatus Dependentiae bacterium]MCG2756070.1 hypothetical protein [Candidatus Dependentiae bacterium]
MKFFFSNFFSKLLFISLLIIFVPEFVYSTLMYNQYDPFAYHTIQGTNKYYKKIESGSIEAGLHISPFYQTTSHARNKEGEKTPEGDIFGWWNMAGLFYGRNNAQTLISASSTIKPFALEQAVGGDQPYIPDATTQGYYPRLSDAWRVLDNQRENNPPVSDFDEKDLVYDYTLSSSFNSSAYKAKMPTTYVDTEKMGIRLELNFVSKIGLGLNIKTGLVDYRTTPSFGLPAGVDDTDMVYKYLTKYEKMDAICKELGLDIASRQEINLEDTFVQLYYRDAFKLMDRDDEHVVNLVPYLAVGAWLPTGKEKNPDVAFSLPTGNNGFWGITVDGSINFDIPDAVQLGVGGGFAHFFKRTLNNQRIANDKNQQGIFPWKARVTIDPGVSWYFNASVYAPYFIDDFSAYLDVIYLKHHRDEIKMNESDSSRNAYFLPEINEKNAEWRSTMFQGGVNYEFTPGLQVGLGFQTHMNGRLVYRNTTIMGTISFIF